MFVVVLIAIASSIGADAKSAPGALVAGFAELRIDDDEQRPLSSYIFYPGLKGVSSLRVGENAVRRGIDVFPNAPLADGRFPLVVLSHGLMGHALNQGWLAMRLAENGYVVATVHHPGTSFLDQDPEQRRALWERPRDVSRTITAMLDHPRFGHRILADRIAVVGHSLGGYDVAALAGTRLDIEAHIAYCREHQHAADCRFARMAGLHEPAASRKRLEQDLHDPHDWLSAEILAYFAVMGLEAP
jgi:predicted dienelactone hydrolase